MIYFHLGLFIIITTGVVLMMICAASAFFYNKIYLKYKKELIDLDFETSLAILRLIINTELDAYEKDIFISKGAITNSNFDNYYKDITNKIIHGLSPEIVSHLSLYITEDMIYVIIARTVKQFLSDKVNGTI